MKSYKNLHYFLIAVLIGAVAISSCKKEDDGPTGPDLGSGNGLAAGVVYDIDGSKLPGATISIGDASAVTDSDGNFEITDAPEGDNIPVNISKEGYKSTQKLISINSDTEYYLEAALGEIQVTKTIPASGGEVSNNNFEINFNDGFVDENGDTYTGDVKVEASYFEPKDVKFIEAFPGRFEGERTDGSITMIESFGYIDVELFDNNGNKLNLADGSNASITLNLDNSISNNAPAEIPIWYYDTDKSKWVEEGKAVKSNGKYEFEVAHFSAWNCDQPAETAELTGRVVDGDGNLLENATVTQKGIDYTGSFSTTTDENGNFTLKAKSNSNQNVYAVYSGFFSDGQEETSPATGQSRDIGDIVIELNVEPEEGWYNLNSENSNSIYFVQMLTEDIGYILSDELKKTTDGGQTWVTILSDGFEIINSRNQTSPAHFMSANEGIVLTSKGKVMKTEDGGNSWQETSDLLGEGYFVGEVQFISNKIGFIFSYNDFYKTTDGGNTWNTVSVPSAQQSGNNAFFISEDIGYLPTYSKLFKTTDGGTTWTESEHNVQINDDQPKIYMKDENTGWMFSSYTDWNAHITTDGGATWTSTSLAGVRDIFFINNSIGWLTASDGIYYTNDGGNSWTKQKDTPTAMNVIHFYDTKIGLSGGDSGILLKTETGGKE